MSDDRPPLDETAPDGRRDVFDVPIGGLLRATHEAIVMIDERQRIVALNPAAEQLLSCRNADALGRPLERFIPARHAASHAAKVRDFAAAGGADRPMAGKRHVTALRADGAEVPVEVMLTTVHVAEAGGPRRYFAAMLRDLSQVRALQHELHRLRQRLRAVFELAPVAIWIVDGDRVIFANSAAGRLFGTGGGHALVGRSIFELIEAGSHLALRRQLQRALAAQNEADAVTGRLAVAPAREVQIALAALPDHGRTTVQMVVSDITEQRRAAAALERSQHELRLLSAAVEEARESERRRIARELHDELGQRLTALKMDLATLTHAGGTDSVHARVEGMLSMLDETVASLRRISADLRPLMLDDLGLNAAIEWLAHDSSQRLGIRIGVRLGETDPPVDERVAIALYRMVQEALTNVARHSHATAAEVALEHDGDDVVLTVQDNGIGFEAGAAQGPGTYGLVGMRERVHLLRGRLEATNAEDGGARITVRLPLHADPIAAPAP